MANKDIFHNNSSSIPKSDPQIVRIDFNQSEIAARKSHLPTSGIKNDMSIVHVNGK